MVDYKHKRLDRRGTVLSILKEKDVDSFSAWFNGMLTVKNRRLLSVMKHPISFLTWVQLVSIQLLIASEYMYL